jgi:hypothetical protein
MVEPPLVVLASVSCSAVVALLSPGWILPNPRFLIKRKITKSMYRDGILVTKDSSLLLHAIHSPLYMWISKKTKKTIISSGFKNAYKKSGKQEN